MPIDINKIIPPNNYANREGFSNLPMINQLNEVERIELEDKLIDLLEKTKINAVDWLIIKSLSYLKSQRALPLLYDLLDKATNKTLVDYGFINYGLVVVICTSIYEINHDPAMVDFAIKSMTEMDKQSFRFFFLYLRKLNNKDADDFIKKYINDTDFTVAFNARQALTYNPPVLCR